MLRVALPAGMATGMVCVADLPAMRVALLRAAENSAVTASVAGTTTTIASVTGVFMKVKSIVFASLVLLAASLGWWILDPGKEPADVEVSQANPAKGQHPTGTLASEASATPGPERQEIAPAPEMAPGLGAASPFKVGPKPEARKRLLVKVVDSEGNPVPGTRISVSSSHRTMGLFGINSMSG